MTEERRIVQPEEFRRIKDEAVARMQNPQLNQENNHQPDHEEADTHEAGQDAPYPFVATPLPPAPAAPFLAEFLRGILLGIAAGIAVGALIAYLAKGGFPDLGREDSE